MTHRLYICYTYLWPSHVITPHPPPHERWVCQCYATRSWICVCSVAAWTRCIVHLYHAITIINRGCPRQVIDRTACCTWRWHTQSAYEVYDHNMTAIFTWFYVCGIDLVCKKTSLAWNGTTNIAADMDGDCMIYVNSDTLTSLRSKYTNSVTRLLRLSVRGLR